MPHWTGTRPQLMPPELPWQSLPPELPARQASQRPALGESPGDSTPEAVAPCKGPRAATPLMSPFGPFASGPPARLPAPACSHGACDDSSASFLPPRHPPHPVCQVPRVRARPRSLGYPMSGTREAYSSVCRMDEQVNA